jgi:hypothetical protein
VADTLTVALVAGGFGIVGTAIGVAGGYFLEWRRGREARAGREETRQHERDDFQRQTLIDFQESLGLYVKAIGDGLPTGAQIRAGQQVPSKELSQAAFNTGQRAHQLANRVRDGKLRSLFDNLWKHSNSVLLFESEAEMFAFIKDLIANLDAVEERLGEVLRPYL